MTNQELEELIQAAMRRMLEEQLSYAANEQERLQAEQSFKRGVRLRPPALPGEIERCEAFLGRRFSASYRHFLLLHNGWDGFFDGGGLFGTEDYFSNAENMLIGIWKWVQADPKLWDKDWYVEWKAPLGEPVPDFYRPQNFYRFMDADPTSSGQAARWQEYIKAYPEVMGEPFVAKHTIIGEGEQGSLFLNIDSANQDGEMEIFDADTFCGSQSHATFYEFLKSYAQE
jgi:hypothetical protein